MSKFDEATLEALPPAIRDQARKANESEDAILKARQAPAPQPEPSPAPVVEPTPAPTQEPQPSPEPAPQPSEPPTPAPSPDPAPVSEPKREDWKQKFLTLQGMFKAEVARESGRMRAEYERAASSMQAQIAALQAQIAAKATSAPAATSEPQPTPESVESFTPEEREALGPELAALLEKREKRLRDTFAKQAQMEAGRVQRDVETLREERFHADLAEMVPDWREVNASDEWKGFLLEVEPFVGVDRNTLLQDAYAKRDAGRVASFFAAFKSRQPAPQPAVVAAEPAPVKPIVPPLASQVTPKSAPGSVPKPAKPTFKHSEVEQFATDVSRGRYDRTPELRARLQAEIDLAIRENRLVPG